MLKFTRFPDENGVLREHAVIPLYGTPELESADKAWEALSRMALPKGLIAPAGVKSMADKGWAVAMAKFVKTVADDSIQRSTLSDAELKSQAERLQKVIAAVIVDDVP